MRLGCQRIIPGTSWLTLFLSQQHRWSSWIILTVTVNFMIALGQTFLHLSKTFFLYFRVLVVNMFLTWPITVEIRISWRVWTITSKFFSFEKGFTLSSLFLFMICKISSFAGYKLIKTNAWVFCTFREFLFRLIHLSHYLSRPFEES